MLPSNVVSFVKKGQKLVMNRVMEDYARMVTPEGQAQEDTTLSKLRHTLSTSLMTAQDKVTNKLSSAKPPEAAAQPEPVKPPEEPPPPKPKQEGKPVSRHGACRVCLKSFKPDEFSKTCGECQQKVCEDCASYSKPDENQDEAWRCSICRRRAASRSQAMAHGQDSTDSLLDAPVLEALQRRHSDVKIGGGSLAPTSTGLAPPRSPELRRHSDVSPASLKELEKQTWPDQIYEHDEELSNEDMTPSPPTYSRFSNAELSDHLGNSPLTEEVLIRKRSAGDKDTAVLKVASEREWRSKGRGSPQGSRATSPSVERRPFVPPQQPLITKTEEPPQLGEVEQDDVWRRSQASRRRKSRVQKQHSYDEETKPTAAPAAEPGLGLPAALPRRASAYDVYAPLPTTASPARRSSFRAPPQQEPDDGNGSSPLSPENASALCVEEDRRQRRRGSQLPDITAIRGSQTRASIAAPVARVADTEAMRRQTSVTDGEAIKIVIHDVDCDASFGSRTTSKRRVNLRRDPTDKAHRTRGFGMRVVGGKVGLDGRLFAYIVWTVPGGPAEKGGLQQGDKVLEWGGVSLVDKTFEEVCSIMDRTGDSVELLVEHGNDLRMCDLLDEPTPSTARKNSGEGLSIGLEGDVDKSPASPTRRKLPKTPDPTPKERTPVSGRVQLQVWYNDDKNELVVSVFAADDLAPRDDPLYGALPEAYLQLRLLPFTGDSTAVKTEVAEATQSPIWNTTLELKNVQGEQLMEKSLEVTLWDFKPDKEQVFLGECCVDLQKALLDDNPVWYRLEDPRQLRSPRSPRSSIASDTSIRTLRKGDRSLSEETSDIEAEGGMFLHPDHAYMGGSRRGSSQSEQLEFEPYQLSRDFSRSLPGSRRSSFQSTQEKVQRPKLWGKQKMKSLEAIQQGDVPPVNYNKERRRSSICRAMRDPDEILRSLKAVKGELLGRSGSISEKRRSRSGSVAVEAKKFLETGHSSDEEDKWSTKSDVKQLGPGQIQPRGYQLKAGGQAEIKLSLLVTKGQLEVEVISARGIKGEPPDTYVKTYLREGERWLQKRKTRVARHSLTPQFRQTLRYAACDIAGRSLLVMLWSKSKGFESNIGLGGAEVGLENLALSQLTLGWYPLFPIHTLGSDSNDSP
nr:regulating synaptic membrane exocytosis protein 1 isoform X3 [Halyomorpha halys]